MSDPNKDGTVTETEEGKGTKVKVEIGRSAELEALRKEKDDAAKVAAAEKKALEDEKVTLLAEKKALEESKTAAETELKEKKAILEQQALTEFENEKKKILDLIKDSRLTEDQKAEIEEKLESPKNLEIVKSLVSMMAAAIKEPEVTVDKGKKPPAGKSTFVPPPEAETFEDKVAMIDELYRRAYYQPQLYTKQQVEEAKAKIDTLFRTLIGSKSWKQLREGQNIPPQQIMSCPKCGRTYIGELPSACGTCGFNFTKTGDFQHLR